jgi:hypothetical protein
MLTAQHAREILNQKPELPSLSILEESIRTQAKNGDNYTWLTQYKLTNEQTDKLVNYGYKVEFFKDQTTRISW